MAQTEPKTASKESAGAVAGYSTESRSEAASATDMCFRVWLAPSKEAVTWNSESALIYMIADLVSASGGATADGASGSLKAHFPNPNSALVSAKRIQAAAAEFLASRPGDRVGVAILIYPPAPQGLNGETLLQETMRRAKPGQILISEKVAKGLHGLPGLELREFRSPTGDTEEPRWAELIWMPPGQQIGPAAATVMISAPILNASPDELPSPQTADAGYENARALEFVADAGEGAAHSLMENLDIEPRPVLARASFWLGAAVVVAIAALAVVFYPTRVSKAPVQVQATPPPSSPDTSAVPTDAPASQSETPANGTASPPDSQAQAPDHKVNTAVAAKPATIRRPKKEPAADDQESSLESFEGMSQRDIPALLALARADAGNGNYEKARREFRVVLRLQPSNQQAKDGMRRLDRAQSSDQ